MTSLRTSSPNTPTNGGGRRGVVERGRREDTPPAPCSVLCGPRSCSTLPSSLKSNDDNTSPEGTPTKGSSSSGRRKLFGLRGLVKMFRRKVVRRRASGTEDGAMPITPPSNSSPTPLHHMRARSASELLRETTSQRSVSSATTPPGGTVPYSQGISLSHDSVFSPDSPPDPPSHSPPRPLGLTSMGVSMSELKAVLRRRVVSGGDDHTPSDRRYTTTSSPAGVRGFRSSEDSGDDDPGLPRSPPTSPTTLDVLNHGLKSVSRATQSTCSDGSLLSMGSSELEDDSAGSLHSSRHSLGDGRLLQVVDLEPVAGEAPGLSHTAARHKIAVRPRRTHASTRPRRPLQQVQSSSILPTTLEVSEEYPPLATPRSLSSSQIRPATTHFDPLNYHPDPHHLHKPNFTPAVDHTSAPTHATELDAEQRKEEPLLTRLFESVRSGRRRHDSDDGLSPRRSDASSRASEVTAKLLPTAIGRSNSRSNPLQQGGSRIPPQYASEHSASPKGHHLEKQSKTRSMETKSSDDKTDGEKRSASVEGRLEGHDGHSYNTPFNILVASKPENKQSNQHATDNQALESNVLYSYEKNNSNVKKAKSFRETDKAAVVVRRESSSRRSWFGRETRMSYASSGAPDTVHVTATRLSASYDNLDDKSTVAQVPNTNTPSHSVISLVSKEQKKSSFSEKVITPAMSSTLSSTDSLTTTEIPGVYIRPLSQYKKNNVDGRDSLEENNVQAVKTHEAFQAQRNSPELSRNIASGPLSLDSSIPNIPKDESFNIRVSISNNSNVNPNVTFVKPSYDSKIRDNIENQNENYRKSAPPSGSSITEIRMTSEPPNSKPSGFAPGPASVLRSMSLSTSDNSGAYAVLNRRASSADELEQKESSDRNQASASQRPKFSRRESSLSRHVSQESTEPEVPEFMRIQLNRVENKPQRVVYASENESSRDSLTSGEDERIRRLSSESQSVGSVDLDDQDTVEFRSTSVEECNTRRESAMSTVSQSSQSSIADSGDELVLRRPLRREKSAVMDTSIVNKKEDEPELLKVFARRSFKVKECFTAVLNDEADEITTKTEPPAEIGPSSITSQMTGITKINPIYSTPTPPRTPVMTTSSGKKFSAGASNKVLSNTFKETPSSSPVPDSSGEYEAPVVENVSANIAVINKSPVQPQVKIPSFTTRSNPSRSRNNSISPISKPNASSVHTSNTNDGNTNKIAMRPMASSREPAHANLETDTPLPVSQFGSVIVSRAQIQPGNLNQADTKVSLKNVCVSSSDATTSAVAMTESVTSVVWPPKSSVKPSANRSSPFTSKVKTEELKDYNSPNENIEISEKSCEGDKHDKVSSKEVMNDDDDEEISQVQSARRKFMNPATKPTTPPTTLSSSPSAAVPQTPTTSAGDPAPVVEARNIVPVFPVNVRNTRSSYVPNRSNSSVGTNNTIPDLQTQHSKAGVVQTAPGIASPSVPHHRHSIGGMYMPHPRQRGPDSASPSPPPPSFRRSTSHMPSSESLVPQSAIIQSALSRQQAAAAPQSTTSEVDSETSENAQSSTSSGEDWRALVRQRREDRLKQTKSVEALTPPMDARSSARSSKVLEMASNFQKLQVA